MRAAKLLWDAKHAADKIARFTAGRDRPSYLADELLRSAVERQFEIVGEALAALRRADLEMAARIPELSRIHSYATVDNELVWSMVEVQLPPLQHTLAKLLTEAG